MRRSVAALRIDFQRSTGAPMPWVGALLLAVGTLLCIGTVWQYGALAGEIAAWESRLDEAKGTARRAPGASAEAARDPKEAADAVRSANAVLDELAVPWAQLFAQIETATGEGAALLSVQPDARNHAVRIGGEAKSLDAVLAYARRLEKSCVLQNVYLAEHEIQTRNPAKPVQFVLVASWTARR